VDNCGNSRANTCTWPRLYEGALLLDQNQSGKPVVVMTLDNFLPTAWPCAGGVSFKCLPYQLSMVGDMPTMVVTGNGESGFDSGEGA
jgi:hypothetical protein